MTLLTTVFAAIIFTYLWYEKEDRKEKQLGTLCLMFWGASLMWLVDAIFEYAEVGAEYFAPAPLDMLGDFYLGISVVAFGLIIWLMLLLVKDPKGVVRSALMKQK